MRVLLIFTFLFNGWLNGVSSQQQSVHPVVVSLPDGKETRIKSPDGVWTLVFECPNDCKERKLWIEGRDVQTRRLVGDYERSLSISWAPDSHHFFVNDFYGSDGADCSVFDPVTLKSTDIAELLVAKEAGIEKFLRAGHSYLEARHWIDSHDLLVVLFGHFDDPPLGGFTLRYRVDLMGRVHKLSQQSEEHPE